MHEHRGVRELKRRLECYDGRPALSWLVGELHDLLGTEKTTAYAFRPRGEGLALDAMHAVGMPPDAAHLFDDWLATQTVDWTLYNPSRPEPNQRNRALTLEQIEKAARRDRRDAPVVGLLPALGLTAAHEQLRALVCDGPSLLAWVGAFQSGPFDGHQQRALAAVVPSLRRRLRLERELAAAPRLQAALGAALEALGRAAFVIDAHGRVLEANAAGRVLLDGARGSDVVGALHEAARGRPCPLALRLTPLSMVGEPSGFLALLDAREGDAGVEPRIAAMAARWRLTPRQREVLALVAQGMTNRTIAAQLGVSEGTVELHVSALFDRAGVENRASLIAQVLRAA